MFRGVFTVLLLGALVVGVAPALAAQSDPGPVPTPAAPVDGVAVDPRAPLPETPLARELRDARAGFAAELRRLTDAWRTATTPAAARALEAQIAALKDTDELRILEIHARHARAAGLTARAEELERQLSGLRAALTADPTAAPTAAGN